MLTVGQWFSMVDIIVTTYNRERLSETDISNVFVKKRGEEDWRNKVSWCKIENILYDKSSRNVCCAEKLELLKKKRVFPWDVEATLQNFIKCIKNRWIFTR